MASSKKNYHVFLSFRGTDVRNTFLHDLYAALNQKGIYTFVDNEELKKGEQISPALMRAIEESRLVIIIFSENYAFSRWCLEELVKIMECKAQKELIVLPVFYKVEPREVRRQIKAYGRAMTKHEEEPEKDRKTVETWKKALSDAGSLSGWVCNDGEEAEVIQSIVKELPIRLERTPLQVAAYPVGIDDRLKELIPLLQKESDGDDVLMIGIWGTGGIGKTAIARAIYNAIETQFQEAIFLERVRETSNKYSDLVKLQKKLLSQISRDKYPTVNSEGEGSSLIRENLGHKKVLLVLDDVDDHHQLNWLAGGGDWFGKGSRIFVTTRDQQLVTSSCCKNHVYPVKTLNKGEARKLFEWHAFKNSNKSEISEYLKERALDYASGLPLALEVLGSFLCGGNEEEWKSELDKLSNSPGAKIDEILKISFYNLEKNESDIFLDIACFFKGKSINYIKEVLDGCGFATTTGIRILINRSLIRNEDGTLQMHDLIQLMGKNIVMQDYTKNPEQCSRLWLFKDVLDILCEEKGTEAIQAMVVDLLTPEDIDLSLQEIKIEAHAFKKMTNLRMLILPEVHISSEGPVRLPSSLRWLKWPNAPLPEFGSGPKELIGLDLQKSHIIQLDKFKHFRKLKYIDFSQCKSLHSVPDISSAPNLKSLYLDGCKSLMELHQSVACHDKLEFLSLQFCSDLRIFPNTLETKSLRAIDLFGCSELKKFPDISEKMQYLEELDLGGTAIEELPTSVENLLSLKIISLRKCKNLAMLPSNIYKWQNLEHLNLVGCSNLVTFPKNLEDSNNPNGNPGFQKLKVLELDGCNFSEVEFLESSSSFPKLSYLGLSRNKFTHLPTRINEYKYLQHLHVDKCKQIQKIPKLPPNAHVLSANCCRSLQEIPDFPSLSSEICWARLSSCRKLFKGANMAHALSLEELPKMQNVNVLLSGREMPEWFFDCKDGFISFTVPRDLCDKFLGLALCCVFGPEGGKGADVYFDASIHYNGKTTFGITIGAHSMESDHVWMGYFACNEMRIVQKLLRDDSSHFQVDFNPVTEERLKKCLPEARLKKCGFRPICEKREDDLRIVHQTLQPLETNRPSEQSDSEEDNWTDTKEEESSSETDDEHIEAIDQEKEKQGLFKADKIGPSEERDSEEDNGINTEEEESSSETDDELIKAIDPENEINELCEADKYIDVKDYECDAADDLCRSCRTLARPRFLRRKKFPTFWE